MNISFSQWASDWHNPNGPMHFLHEMNVTRIDYMIHFLSKPHCSLMGLDVGTGGGLAALELSKRGYLMEGIDIEAPLIQVAQNKALEEGLNVSFSAVDVLSFEPYKLYDFICCFEMMEHHPEPALVAKKMLTWLKPGGKIFISTINKTLSSYLSAILLAEHVMNWLPIGTHEYKKFIPPVDLIEILKPATCLSLKGLIYNPFEKKFFVGDSHSVNYIGVWESQRDLIST